MEADAGEEVALTPREFMELAHSDPDAIAAARSVWPARGERGDGVIWVRYARPPQTK